MAEVLQTAPLSIALEVRGHRPSLAVTGNADQSNMSRVVAVLDRLAEEHERCVSLDLGGLESMDAGAIESLAGTAGAYRDRQKRLHIRNASDPVRSTLDRLMISEAFCVEQNCCYDACPGNCGIASASWEIDVFTLPSQMISSHEARVRVDRVAEAVGFAACRRKDIMLAVGEAVANAIRHGSCDGENGSFTVSCLGTRQKLCVSISDSGCGFEPDNLPSLEDALFLEHGRGVHCMRALMDEVSFHFDGGTTVRMVKLSQ